MHETEMKVCPPGRPGLLELVYETTPEAAEERKALKARVAQLEAELKEAQEEAEEEADSNSQLNNQVEKLQAELDTVRAALSELEDDKKEVDHELGQLVGELNAAEKELEKAQAKILHLSELLKNDEKEASSPDVALKGDGELVLTQDDVATLGGLSARVRKTFLRKFTDNKAATVQEPTGSLTMPDHIKKDLVDAVTVVREFGALHETTESLAKAINLAFQAFWAPIPGIMEIVENDPANTHPGFGVVQSLRRGSQWGMLFSCPTSLSKLYPDTSFLYVAMTEMKSNHPLSTSQTLRSIARLLVDWNRLFSPVHNFLYSHKLGLRKYAYNILQPWVEEHQSVLKPRPLYSWSTAKAKGLSKPYWLPENVKVSSA